eukprot:Selendium_serpulae@DN8220_c0_g1_i1.p1
MQWCGNEWETDCFEARNKGALVTYGIMLGGIVGCIAANKLSSYGRLFATKVSDVIFVLAAIGGLFSNSFAGLFVSRVLSGVAMGITATVIPKYIAEISPAPERGFNVTLHQQAMTAGMLIAAACQYGVTPPDGTPDFRSPYKTIMWSECLWALPIIPAVAQFLFFTIYPLESPPWLVSKRLPDKALTVLKTIYGHEAAHYELNEILAATQDSSRLKAFKPISAFSTFVNPQYRKIAVLGCCIAVFQQACGYILFVSSSTSLFAAVGLDSGNHAHASFVVAFLNYTMTL